MLNNILNELRTPVFLVNKHNNVVYLNAIGEEFFGYSGNLIIGKSIYNLIPKDSPISNLLTRVRKFKHGLTEDSLDFSNINFPNRRVRAHIVPLSLQSNQIMIQLSELTVSEMFQSQRINSKMSKSFSCMIDMLMHELKNPIAGIKGASQLIESDLNSDKNIKELTTLIDVESDRIVSLLNRMEQINNNSITTDYQFLNVHEILNHCKRVAQNSFGLNIKFIESFDPSLPYLFANKDLLIQILINILKNSCEASFNNGKIKIKTSFNSDKKISFSHEEIPLSLPLQLEIIDYGEGIAKNLLPNIFDPFVSTKKNGKGLGLSIVASGLHDMGAVIDISSSPSLTNVCINFPLKK
ncbi:ATP-binding protein [Alphaproteobacteria bacterium]|nr:ATP-binding protein [Alphaproteobacteria bacterium]